MIPSFFVGLRAFRHPVILPPAAFAHRDIGHGGQDDHGTRKRGQGRNLVEQRDAEKDNEQELDVFAGLSSPHGPGERAHQRHMAECRRKPDDEHAKPVQKRNRLPDNDGQWQGHQRDRHRQRHDNQIVIVTGFQLLGDQVRKGEESRRHHYRPGSGDNVAEAGLDDDHRPGKGHKDRHDPPEPQPLAKKQGGPDGRPDRPEIQDCIHIGKRDDLDRIEPEADGNGVKDAAREEPPRAGERQICGICRPTNGISRPIPTT